MNTLKLLVLSGLINFLVVTSTIYFFKDFSTVKSDLSIASPNDAQNTSLEAETQKAQDEISIPKKTDIIKKDNSYKDNIDLPVQKTETTQQLPAETKQQNQQNLSRCLVKLYDKTYDLEAFKNIHSGGDIFQCNTDILN